MCCTLVIVVGVSIAAIFPPDQLARGFTYAVRVEIYGPTKATLDGDLGVRKQDTASLSRHTLLHGDALCSVSRFGWRCEFASVQPASLTGFAFIVRADSDIVVLNQAAKTFKSIRLPQEELRTVAQSAVVVTPSGEVTTISGYRAERLHFEFSLNARPLPPEVLDSSSAEANALQLAMNLASASGELWVSSGVDQYSRLFAAVATPIAQLCGLSGVPPNRFVVKASLKAGNIDGVFEMSALKPQDLHQDLFRVPSGYRESEVIMNWLEMVGGLAATSGGM